MQCKGKIVSVNSDTKENCNNYLHWTKQPDT